MAAVPLQAQNSTAFTSPILNTPNYEFISFAATPLTTDTIAVNIVLPDGNVAPAPDLQGVTTGLSTSAKVRTYRGGSDFQLVKTGTTDNVYTYYIVHNKSV